MATVEAFDAVILSALATARQELQALLPDLLGEHHAPECTSRLRALADRELGFVAAAACRRDAGAALAAALGRELDGKRRDRREATENTGDGVGLDGLVRLSSDILGLERQAELVRDRRFRHFRRALHAGLPALGAELQARSADWQEAERRLKDFFGVSSGLWDLDPGVWKRIDWTGLEAAAAWLADWPELVDLARLLGRHPGGKRSDDQPIPLIELSDEAAGPQVWTEALGRSEINGYTRGNQLELLPAFETVLLSDPLTEGLFLKSHAEGTLTNIEYLTEAEHRLERPGDDAAPPPPMEPEQGPVIICADTSGSMTGLPERVAKALTLALVRACHAEGRGCWLIGFSTEIQCLDLSDPVQGIVGASAFLAHAFRGGTDLRPALAKAIEVLDNPGWTKADLLIISDFRVPKLMIKKAAQIDPVRERHQARLHALSVSSGEATDDMHVFDSHWHFRIGASGAPMGIGHSQFKEQGGLFRVETAILEAVEPPTERGTF